MAPDSWILECARMVGVAQDIISLIENSIANYKTVLTSKQEVLGSLDIKRGIFEGHSLTPLVFLMIIIPLAVILRDTRAGYCINSRKKDPRSITCSLWMT